MVVIHRELAPIIIGMSRKSGLQGKDADVGAALRTAFDWLDEKYPYSPKILLTALAEGTDTLAAEDVVERKGWDIIAPLPRPLDRYLQDLDDLAATRLRALIEKSSRRQKLRLFTLDPLRHADDPRPPTSSDLAQLPGPVDSERTEHHLQVDLFIAERCAILIVVTQASERARMCGPTARIVDYRLHGNLDQGARNMVRRSRVLVEPPPLDAPHTGPVWLIDPAKVDLQRDPNGQPECEVLLPADENVPKAHRLRASLRLADRLNEFNIRAQRLELLAAHQIETAGGSNMGQPAAMLCELMRALSTIQMDMNRKVKWSVGSLALLFCIALFMFEAQVDLNMWWGVFGYIGALVLGIITYKFATARRWQPFAQDYRAVAEALRVQIAWWNCGLVGPHYRVDRFYLRGTTGSLGLVRAAIRQLVTAAELLSYQGGPETERMGRKNHGAGRGENAAKTPDKNSGTRWIEEQIVYFDDRLVKRRTWVSFIDASSWFLLVASLVPEVVFAVNSFHGDLVRPVLEKAFGELPPGVLFGAVVATVLLIFVVSSARWLFSPAAWRDRARWIFEEPNLAVSSIAGAFLAIGLYECAAFIRSGNISDALLILGGIFVASIAYAMQFISDQLSWAGELRGYEDALEIFRRARAALTEIDNSEIADAERVALRNTIVEALGKEALKENEGWLRAHRARPLQPLPPA